MRVLHIDSSARIADSNSRLLSTYFVDLLRERNVDLKIDRLDLALTPPPHVSEIQTAGMYTLPDDRTPDMVAALKASDLLVDRVLASEFIIAAMPMYNFGMPSVFKAFVDNIVRVGRTFVPTQTGFAGVLGSKPILFITSRGASYGEGAALHGHDCLSPHLKSVFEFMGATNMEFVNVEPLQFGSPSERDDAIVTAKSELKDLVDKLLKSLL